MNVLNPNDVLLIDDDLIVYAQLREICKDQHDIELFFASSSLETFQILIQKKVDIILINESFSSIDSTEFVKILNEMVPGIPIIFLQNNNSDRVDTSDIGIQAVMTLPLKKKHVLSSMRQVLRNDPVSDKEADLFERLSLSEFKLREKMLIMRTTLDILGHDTKNMFIKIFTLFDQLPESDVATQINDYIHELYDGISEALGYIGAKKRISSLFDTINSIKIGVEQTPLPLHSRVKLELGSRKLFFVETTRLFKNVILNIVDNAIKYSPPTSEVIISLTRMFDTIRIRVSDRGIGIPDKEKDRVFARSYRSTISNKFEGSGQGLWISYNILKEEGGTIIIEDNPGGGSVFTIEIPACKVASFEQAVFRLSQWYVLPSDIIEKKMNAMQTIIQLEFPDQNFDLNSVVFTNLLDHLRNEKRLKEREKYLAKLRSFLGKNADGKAVLLADDSLFVHYSIAPILIKHGFRIADYAFNGAEACMLFNMMQPDIALLDVTMPVKTGIETAKEFFRQSKNVKVIFLTALAEHGPLLESLEKMFDKSRYRVVGKPVIEEVLIDTIVELLQELSI